MYSDPSSTRLAQATPQSLNNLVPSALQHENKRSELLGLLSAPDEHTQKKKYPLNIPNVDPDFEDLLVSQDPAELGGEGFHVADMEQIQRFFVTKLDQRHLALLIQAWPVDVVGLPFRVKCQQVGS